MNQYPEHRFYTSTHEWIEVNDNILTIGITDFAQSQLGDVVFVELPVVPKVCRAGDELVVLESVKTAADVYAPAAGEVIEINQALENNAACVNLSPHEKAWLIKIALSDSPPLATWLTAAEYQQRLQS